MDYAVVHQRGPCWYLPTLFFLLSLGWGIDADAGDGPVDLSGATVFSPMGQGPRVERASRMLVEEIQARSWVAWRETQDFASAEGPLVVVGTEKAVERWIVAEAPPLPDRVAKAEGYRIGISGSRVFPIVWVVGEDERGVLFGVGRLLRTLRIERERVWIPGDFSVSTAPRYPVRGHQLGYRPKTNSYDGWTLGMWEQYIRDLAIFGCNAIELIPPRSDDDPDSPHFPRPRLETMREMSRLADAYGLDVWIWFPALDEDYTNAETLASSLKEWGQVFEALPRIDAVFVPGGDPGRTPPSPLFRLLEEQSSNLRNYHPSATVWFSPQGFNQKDFEEILQLVQAEPEWLGGLVFGPQVRMNLPELRQVVPNRYPIRFYPDITHNRSAQYPVPDWDRAFALTLGREAINPRPLDQAAILRRLSPFTCGFITYSEGCNDDVNKTIWSALGWDPETDPLEVMREYARYYIDSTMAEGIAQGLMALERNWKGPAATNIEIESTLSRFRVMEREASPRVLANWRFQQALYRAYYDAFIRARLLDELALEGRAMTDLRRAPEIGSLLALDRAEDILRRALTDPAAPDLRARVCELAEALFQSIRMQLSVTKYRAIEIGRGTSQDTMDRPLNNRVWLVDQFTRIRSINDEGQRLAEIDRLLNWNNPGPGGFYDDLGNTSAQPHLVRGASFEDDPAQRSSVLMHFDDGGGGPISWRDQALVLYDQPLRMRYRGLESGARYRLRVVYSLGPIRLSTSSGLEIHPALDRKYELLEFPIPDQAIENGTLSLEFQGEAGRGGNGRTCSVLEAWLIRSPDDQ